MVMLIMKCNPFLSFIFREGIRNEETIPKHENLVRHEYYQDSFNEV